MKTATYAEVGLLVGPFTQSDVVQVPARGEEGLKFLKERYGDALIALVYFDIKEIEFQGLKFTSEPHHHERVDVMKQEEFKEKILAEREGLSQMIGGLIESLTQGEESEDQLVKEAPKSHRVLH